MNKHKDGDMPRDIPEDVWKIALRHADEYGEDDEPFALEFAISLAIIEERQRCAAIASGPAEAWGEFLGGTPERDRIASAILTPSTVKTEGE